MHAIVYVFLVLLILFVINTIHNKKNTDVNQSEMTNVIEKGEYYEILDLSTNEERKYKYIIYNSKHKIVKEEANQIVIGKIRPRASPYPFGKPRHKAIPLLMSKRLVGPEWSTVGTM